MPCMDGEDMARVRVNPVAYDYLFDFEYYDNELCKHGINQSQLTYIWLYIYGS